MTPSQNFLFPLILGILSQKPQLSESQSELYKDLAKKLKSDYIKVNNLKETLDSTIELGKGLGILTVQDGTVRMLFQMKGPRTFQSGVPVDNKFGSRGSGMVLPIYKKLINKQRGRRRKKPMDSTARQRTRQSVGTRRRKRIVRSRR